jgi:hypothetical protein
MGLTGEGHGDHQKIGRIFCSKQNSEVGPEMVMFIRRKVDDVEGSSEGQHLIGKYPGFV